MQVARRPATWLPIVALTVALAITAAAGAIAGVMYAAVLLMAALAVRSPLLIASVLGGLTAAFPKAGVRLVDFPIPVFLFALMACLVLLRLSFRHHPRGALTHLIMVVYVGWLAVRSVQFLDEGIEQVLAFLAWALLPLVAVALAANLIGVPRRFLRAVEVGYLASVGYAIAQFIVGVEKIAVEGLTYAFNDDLSLKNNFIGSELGDFSKIPSTYQNGNIYGVVSAVFLVVALRRVFERRATTFDIMLVIGSTAAIALSGSRTAIVAATLASVPLLVRRGSISRKASAIGAIVGVGAIVLAVQPALAARYSYADLASTGGAGRAEIWRQARASMTPSDWIVGTSERQAPEGWGGIVMQLGLIGVVLLILAIGALTRQRPEWTIVLLALAGVAVIDSSYSLFPTWFLPAAMMAVHEPPPPRASPETASAGHLARVDGNRALARS